MADNHRGFGADNFGRISLQIEQSSCSSCWLVSMMCFLIKRKGGGGTHDESIYGHRVKKVVKSLKSMVKVRVAVDRGKKKLKIKIFSNRRTCTNYLEGRTIAIDGSLVHLEAIKLIVDMSSVDFVALSADVVFVTTDILEDWDRVNQKNYLRQKKKDDGVHPVLDSLDNYKRDTQ